MDEEEEEGLLKVLRKYTFSDLGLFRFPLGKSTLDTTAEGILYCADNKDMQIDGVLRLLTAEARIMLAVDAKAYGYNGQLETYEAYSLDFAAFKRHVAAKAPWWRREGLERFLRGFEPSSQGMEMYYLKSLICTFIYPRCPEKTLVVDIEHRIAYHIRD